MSTDITQVLRIGDGRDWHFVNGAWEDGDAGVLSLPAEWASADGAGMQGYHFAFHRHLCLGDGTVRFAFRHNGFSDVGVVLRAQDASHFTLLHFPYIGQANNTQNFWAALSRMDDTGHLRLIKLDLIRREPANREIWHAVALTLRGGKLHVRIGNHGLFAVEDETMPRIGFIGVCQFNAGSIRDVTIEGTRADGAIWDESVAQPTNWFHPCPNAAARWQMPADLAHLPDGELLLTFAERQLEHGAPSRLMTRSTDGGRTWTESEALLMPMRDASRLHVTPRGRLLTVAHTEDGWVSSVSRDAARTWSAPQPLPIGTVPEGFDRWYFGPQCLLNLADGGLLLFAYAQASHEQVNVRQWGALHAQAFCCRSADDGDTWSDWANIDNSAHLGVAGQQDNLDLTETCAVQTGDGAILSLTRPVYSPWMWESWSNDGGQTWGPCMPGPFPGYATPNMLRTTSGRLVVAHRLPGLTMQMSPDDGRTWDTGTMIDSSIWAMGCMVEVEPDRVLYVYYDSFESLMRAQFFHVTARGITPCPRAEVSHD